MRNCDGRIRIDMAPLHNPADPGGVVSHRVAVPGRGRPMNRPGSVDHPGQSTGTAPLEGSGSLRPRARTIQFANVFLSSLLRAHRVPSQPVEPWSRRRRPRWLAGRRWCFLHSGPLRRSWATGR